MNLARIILLMAASWALAGCSFLESDDGGEVAGPAGVDVGAAPDGDPNAGDSATAGFDAGAPPVACPDGTAATGVRPTPNACPAYVPPWFEADKVPAPTLTLAAGPGLSDSDEFVPWQDGQWAPIHLGMRGGVGVWTALQVKLPGETADKVKLLIDVPGIIDCGQAGLTLQPMVWFAKVPDQPGVYHYGGDHTPGACIQLMTKKSHGMCNEWLTIHAAVRLPATDKWGHARYVVQLYNETSPWK